MLIWLLASFLFCRKYSEEKSLCDELIKVMTHVRTGLCERYTGYAQSLSEAGLYNTSLSSYCRQSGVVADKDLSALYSFEKDVNTVGARRAAQEYEAVFLELKNGLSDFSQKAKEKRNSRCVLITAFSVIFLIVIL